VKRFVEVCIYEVKSNKTAAFEELLARVAKHHREFPGVVTARYIKRTHRQGGFAAAKKGAPPIQLTRPPKSVTYVLYWELDSAVTHGRATKSGLAKFYKEFARCLVAPPKMILGERIQ
jgi:heme-degrading monooxygenase HmoA